MPSLSEARLLFACAPALEHHWPGHPESAARVPAILAELEGAGLTQSHELLKLGPAPPATPAHLQLVHRAQFLESLESLTRLRAPCLYDSAPTYLTRTSFQDAALGVGAALALVDAVVLESRSRAAAGGTPGPSGFALCRPPGHHALPDTSMGFCILSTAAIAARHAQQTHGLQRVLIYDFDVHHGNGTAETFEYDPSVLYVSTHQRGAYPQTGDLLDVGSGPGQGFTVNVPLPGGSGDAAARACMESIVAPLAERFQPHIMLVSAGYDAHWRDPLAGLSWRDGTYHALSLMLRGLAERLCGGRIVFLLEGGYDLKGLARGTADTFRALMATEPGAPDRAERDLLEEPGVAQLLREVRALHSL